MKTLEFTTSAPDVTHLHFRVRKDLNFQLFVSGTFLYGKGEYFALRINFNELSK
jgi:hypothetical protein